jgi:hypothetical protein
MILTDSDSMYFILDFDRCIGNTEKIHEVLWKVIEKETGISADVPRAAKRTLDAQGYAFDTVEYVAKDLLSRQRQKMTWQEIRQLFIAEAKTRDLLEPHANELLERLDSKAIPYGILTYGRESWQLTKLEAAGLVDRGVPFEITGIEHKGEILSSWKHDDEFIVPPAMTHDFHPIHVQKLIFLDDKPRSFEAMPPGVYGICVRPTYPLLPSQKGEVPDGVVEVQGLEGAIRLLQLA